MLKRIYGLNFLDSFIVGITTVVVPLLMLERGIDIATMGVAFSLAPLFGVAVTLAAAAAADMIGERVIYSLNALCNFAQAIVYAFARTAPFFSLGKIMDGTRSSLIFSVNRKSVMAAAPDRKHFALAGMTSGRAFYQALGSLSVGLLFAVGGFGILLSLIAAVSIFMLLISLRVKNTHTPKSRVHLKDLSPFGKSRLFYEVASLLVLGGAVYVCMMYFLFPIFFTKAGFSLAEIGTFYTAYFVIFGVVLNVLSHRSVGTWRAAAAGAIIYTVALCGIALGSTGLLPFFFILMAFGDACLGVLWEEINYLATRGIRKKSTELALLNTPFNFASFLLIGASGFAVAAFGFLPFLALFAVCEVVFAAWCARLSMPKI
jgi:MFS family permease